MEKKGRKKTPPDIEAEVLAANKHACCICGEEKFGVQIHHIDGDRSNYDPSNLCVLCLPHHAKVESKSSQSKGYSKKELRIYKEKWEDHCRFEHRKGTVVYNYFIFTENRPELRQPDFLTKFVHGIASGATTDELHRFVNASAITVEKSTGNPSLAKEFESFVLKENDE